MGDWNVEDGVYHILVAASSRDIRLRGSVKIHPAHPVEIRDRSAELPSYYSGNVQNVPDEEFEKLIGYEVPPKALPEGTVFDANSTLADADGTRWGGRINRVVSVVVQRIPLDGLVGDSEMAESIVKEMPVRKLMMMTSGIVNEEMCNDVLKILNDESSGAAVCDLLKILRNRWPNFRSCSHKLSKNSTLLRIVSRGALSFLLLDNSIYRQGKASLATSFNSRILRSKISR